MSQCNGCSGSCNCNTTTGTQDAICSLSVVKKPCDRADEYMNWHVLEQIRSYLCTVPSVTIDCDDLGTCLDAVDLDCKYFTGTGVAPIHV